MWSNWYERNAGKEKALTTAEFVLKKIDEAGGEVTLLDSAESSTLPAAISTTTKVVLQTIRNNLKWLFNNKANLTGATFTGTVSAPSFNATSSETVKKNIKPFKKSALKIIKKVDIVSFKYKKNKDAIPQIGFIAENTNPLLSGENQDSMRINTTIGLLLKAVQELNEKEEMFKKELKEIKKKR